MYLTLVSLAVFAVLFLSLVLYAECTAKGQMIDEQSKDSWMYATIVMTGLLIYFVIAFYIRSLIFNGS